MRCLNPKRPEGRLAWSGVLLFLFFLGCDGEDPAVRFVQGYVYVDGHRLRLGVPPEEWQAALGPGQELDSGRTRYWPKLRFLAHLTMTSCRDRWVTGARISFTQDPEMIPENLGRPVQLEECRFEPGDRIPPHTADCGACIMGVGQPFDFLYQCDSDGIGMGVSREAADNQVNIIQYSLDEPNRIAIGVPETREGHQEFLDAGGCKGRRDRVLLGQAWRDQRDAEFRAIAKEMWRWVKVLIGWE